MKMTTEATHSSVAESINEEDVDPITDIIDYLVHCAKINFRAARVGEAHSSASDRARVALRLYRRSPSAFLAHYGKYLAHAHLGYFEALAATGASCEQDSLRRCLEHLKAYHSDEGKHKRTRNRRYKALQKLRDEGTYFSEKEMMFRNPLLYEQLVGRYLTAAQARQRDAVDADNLTLLDMILQTVDKNRMLQTKQEQMSREGRDESPGPSGDARTARTKHWGSFERVDGDGDTPDLRPAPRHTPAPAHISGPERSLLHEEFVQEMYASFLEGRDADVDYDSIDHDDQYDDLQQMSRDAEDRYFDEEADARAAEEPHIQK